jgi:hypothetical protein
MRGLIAILSVACWLFSAQAVQANKRVAFVVGNGAYKNVPQLPNPPLDAKSMASLLRSIGFDVVEGTDLTRDTMTELLLEFGKKAQGADIALFFYAGHGIAVNGANYLLPIDADIKSEMDVKLGAAISLDRTLDQTMGGAKAKLVFLDACRDNPFAARSRATATSGVAIGSGLAEMRAGEGTLIALATGPGQTALDGPSGAHSPFTSALLAHVATPGVEIQQAMTEVRAEVSETTNKGQLPWGHTNLTNSVILNPASGPAVLDASALASNEIELQFWRVVKDSKEPAALNAYLSSYPNGQFKSLALARIALLEGNSSTVRRSVTETSNHGPSNEASKQQAESKLGLDKRAQQEAQRSPNGAGGRAEADEVKEHHHSGNGGSISGGRAGGSGKSVPLTKESERHRDNPRPRTTVASQEDNPQNTLPPAPTPMSPPAPTPTPAELPDFPWPPPAPSSYYVLPDNLLRSRQTLGEASDAIISALESTGYVERTFFRTGPGGVALVTRLERFMPDGSPARPERWSIDGNAYRSAADIAKFLRGLFFVEEGHYRLIVFVLQRDAFIPSSQEMDEPQARNLIKRGANILPAETRKQTFIGNRCTVLIYEFASDGKAVHFVEQSPLTAKEHLDKAGLLALLGKVN